MTMLDCNDENKTLSYKKYFGVSILSARNSVVADVRNETEKFVRSKISPGIYRDYNIINNLFKDIFSFLYTKITPLIKDLSSVQTLSFLFYQYSLSCKIEALSRTYSSHKDAELWLYDRGCLRRSLKFLIEKIAENYHGDENLCKFDFCLSLEYLLEFTEMSFFFSMLSAGTYGVSKDRTILEIRESSEIDAFNDFIKVSVENFDNDSFSQSVHTFHEFNKRNGFSSSDCIAYFQKESKDAFQSLANDSYEHFFSIFKLMTEICSPDKFGVYCISTSQIKSSLINNFSLSQECVNLFFNTFSLTQNELQENPREIFKTKQKNRLKLKSILQINLSGEDIYMYTNETINEGLLMLVDSLIYKTLPEEWKSDDMKLAFSRINKQFGSDFEKLTSGFLKKWMFEGRSYKSNLPCNVKIPPDVGEIDYLGFSQTENCIVCFEFKNVRGSTDPLEFRDDLDQFIYKKDSYLNKYRKKVEFVKSNISKLVNWFNHKYDVSLSSEKMMTAIITYTPNISQHFIDEYKCVSLSQFEECLKENPAQFFLQTKPEESHT